MGGRATGHKRFSHPALPSPSKQHLVRSKEKKKKKHKTVSKIALMLSFATWFLPRPRTAVPRGYFGSPCPRRWDRGLLGRASQAGGLGASGRRGAMLTGSRVGALGYKRRFHI